MTDAINTLKIQDVGKNISTGAVVYTLINSGTALTYPLKEFNFTGDKTTNNQQAMNKFDSADANDTYFAHSETSATSLPASTYTCSIVVDVLNSSYTNHLKYLYQMYYSRSLLKFYNTPIIDQDSAAESESSGGKTHYFVYVRLKSLALKASADSIKENSSGEKVSGYLVDVTATFERAE